MKLITISGLDGSGKSTQIQLLKFFLESQGKKVFYFHAIEQSLVKKIIDFRNRYCLICKLLGRCKVYKEKSVTRANAFQLFLRKVFLAIDIFRFKLLRNKLSNIGYDYILSDRYFYDSIINISFLAGNLISNWRLNFQKNLQKPNLAIYLQTDPEKIMSRERVPDQGSEYLKKKKELYDAKISEWDWKVMDGNRDRNVIFEEIKNHVDSR